MISPYHKEIDKLVLVALNAQRAKLSPLIHTGFTQLNTQGFVVWRFVAVGHRSQRPMNRTTTAGASSRIP